MDMKHPGRAIELSTWKRFRHYALFAERDYPFLAFATELDISAWDAARRKSGRKFFPAFLQSVMLALNSIENFRYRIHNGQVILCEKTDPAFVVFDPRDELYYFATAETNADPDFFDRDVEAAKQQALAARCLDGGRLDVAYISCVPWFSFTDAMHPMRLKTADSIPRVIWGQCRRSGERASISFSVTGHHGLFDGLHLAKLFAAIQGREWIS